MLSQDLSPRISMIAAISILLFVLGCSEEDHSQLGKLSDIVNAAEAMEEPQASTYNEQCTEPVGDFQQVDNGTMTPEEQGQAAKIIKICLDEMQTEINLTIEESPAINELLECNKNLTSGKANLSELSAVLDSFKSLPNTSAEESNAVALAFSLLSFGTIKGGAEVVLNRISICSLEKIMPELS